MCENFRDGYQIIREAIIISECIDYISLAYRRSGIRTQVSSRSSVVRNWNAEHMHKTKEKENCNNCGGHEHINA